MAYVYFRCGRRPEGDWVVAIPKRGGAPATNQVQTLGRMELPNLYCPFGTTQRKEYNGMRNETIAVFEMTIGLLVMAGPAPAASTLINTCPFVITSPGDYQLSADLACLGGGGGAVGITIKSSHVTLKLEGHTIRSVASVGTA